LVFSDFVVDEEVRIADALGGRDGGRVKGGGASKRVSEGSREEKEGRKEGGREGRI